MGLARTKTRFDMESFKETNEWIFIVRCFAKDLFDDEEFFGLNDEDKNSESPWDLSPFDLYEFGWVPLHVVFWNKNTQTFCFTDSLLAEFLDHLNVKKIFRYCKALNATTKPRKSALRGRGCECQQVISWVFWIYSYCEILTVSRTAPHDEESLMPSLDSTNVI